MILDSTTIGCTRSVRRTRAHADHGFTLIEVMLAVLLGSVVVAVTGVITVQSLSIQRAVRSDMVDRWDHVHVFRQFEIDVQSALGGLPEDAPAIRINPEAGTLLVVYGIASMPGDGSLVRRRLPAKIIYQLEEAPGSSGPFRLVRVVTDLTSAEVSGFRHQLADGIHDATMEQYGANGWTSTLGKEASEDPPTALRLACDWDGDSHRVQSRTVLLSETVREPRTSR